MKDRSVTRRQFLKDGASLGVGATALAGIATHDATLEAQRPGRWDRAADVVVIGAGASGLCAAIMARDQGASVLIVEQNQDIGGHAMVSGGRVPLGGGHSLQKKYGISDSAEQVYLDHTAPANLGFRYSDRDLVRVWANENLPTMEFLLENGVKFVDQKPTIVNGGTVPRLFRTQLFSDDLWSTPILHDTLTGLRINGQCQVIDLRGQVIPGLYCAGESGGGFALHGLPRVTVFGRIAGREAARATT